MRKLWAVTVGALLLSCVAAPSLFAFSSVAKTTTTASVTFIGNGTLAFSIQLRNVSGDGIAASQTAIGWDPTAQSITPGVTGWKVAQQYIVLHSTITNATGGVQIYTNNKGSGASPAYSGAATTNPAGLVCVEVSSAPTLSMCWRVVDSSTNTLTVVQGSDNKLYSSELGGQAGLFPCFAWLKDFNTPTIASANTTAFVNGEDYVTVKEASRGMHYAEGPNIGESWGSSPSPDCIYIGANFLNALTPRTYRTTTLRLESFTD